KICLMIFQSQNAVFYRDHSPDNAAVVFEARVERGSRNCDVSPNERHTKSMQLGTRRLDTIAGSQITGKHHTGHFVFPVEHAGFEPYNEPLFEPCRQAVFRRDKIFRFFSNDPERSRRKDWVILIRPQEADEGFTGECRDQRWTVGKVNGMFGSTNHLIRRQGYRLDYVVVALCKKFARLLLPKLFEND